MSRQLKFGTSALAAGLAMVAVSLVTSLVHGDAILYVTGFLFIIGGTAGLLGFLAIVGVAWQER